MLFTHIINPFRAHHAPGVITQDATFRALEEANVRARAMGIGVECLGVVFPDDAQAVKSPAHTVPVLSRSVLDVATLKPPRRFPLLRDLLGAAVTHGSGEFVVFTNMDIILQPYFYVVVARLLRRMIHYAPFLVINRRTVQPPDDECSHSWVQAAYSEYGADHEGWDCFVFPRAWINELDLGEVCIGVPYFDTLLLHQLDQLSGFRGAILTRQMLTAHIGDDKAWQTLHEYNEFNKSLNLRSGTQMEGRNFLWPDVRPDSLAEEACLRILGRGGARRPGLKVRALTRLGIDSESICWRWVSAERQRLGMRVYPDVTPRMNEYVHRGLKSVGTRFRHLRGTILNGSN